MAVSVLPTPLGPTKQEDADRAAGVGKAGSRGSDALSHGFESLNLADHALFELVLEVQNGLDLVGHHLADGNTGPAGDDLGDGLGVDADLHERIFALKGA